MTFEIGKIYKFLEIKDKNQKTINTEDVGIVFVLFNIIGSDTDNFFKLKLLNMKTLKKKTIYAPSMISTNLKEIV